MYVLHQVHDTKFPPSTQQRLTSLLLQIVILKERGRAKLWMKPDVQQVTGSLV